MDKLAGQSLPRLAEALRRGTVSAREVAEHAIARHAERGERFHAYKLFDGEGALQAADAADRLLAGEAEAPPLCGITFSIKDLYGADGLPTFAGTARRLPDVWSRDAWLVSRLRAQGAVPVGKTHTVELAYGALGINPHWGTPRNPWDVQTHRIPGGSSCGAGVSLWEESALLALGTDTGGSIRVPASMTGTVGHKTTYGRWSTAGVVPLSSTLDSVGALTRSVEDSIYFFGAVDPAWGDPAALLEHISTLGTSEIRVAIPRCGIWDDCQADIADSIHTALDDMAGIGWRLAEVDGALLDDAFDLYMHGGIAAAECRDFLARDLPGWVEILHPTVGSRLAKAITLEDPRYARSVAEYHRMSAAAPALFDDATVIALPTVMITPPPVADLDDLERYIETNRTALRPTCPVSMLGLCAVTIPVGLDRAGMPVGLQLVAPDGQDETVLAAGFAVERALGTLSSKPS